ncbi:hypothetical protein [Nocardia abscessus]|uniref:hypothetical protein n=1 Tax=Nocardia abscessus TaxID=120957 RepID=UPI0012FBD202|nr:hypothetical protein [Nocardia abscessus]MCC3326611.1 hypothetical protein [Nocardia abscessus]
MDEYERDRDNYKPHERGRIFENGIEAYFKDRERGYLPSSRIYKTPEGRIQFDHVREEQGKTFSIEDKSGRIEGPKDEKQLKALRVLLETGVVQEHTLRSVEGETVSKDCQVLINGLKQDFGDRFTHLEISRAEARTIWALGVDLERSKQRELPERGKQLELQGVAEKAREEKAQELQKRRDKIAERERARERAEKFRNMLRFRGGATRGRAEAPERVERERRAREEAERARQAGRTPESERARIEREAAERVAQEFPTPNQFQQREAADTGEHAAREAADAASLERAAADARTAEEKAREAREAADKERAEELARLQARGVPPEVVKILGLGQAEPPSAAVREPPGHAPGVVRGGTGQGQERSRGISRDR